MANIKYRVLLLSLLATTPLKPTNEWMSVGSLSLEYLLSFGMVGLAVKNHLSLEHFENLPDASPAAVDFVHEQFKYHRVRKYETIKVKIGSNYGAINDTLITLQQNEDPTTTNLDNVIEASKNDKNEEIRQNALYSLGLFRAVLSHEIQHLKNRDLQNLIRAQYLIPLITYGGTRLLEEGIKYMLPKSLTSMEVPSYIKNSFRIAKGLTRYIINSALYLKLSRHQEQRADDSIPNDPNLLKAFKEFLYMENDERRELVRRSYGDHAAELFDTNRVFYEFQNFVMDSEHPSPLTRIKNIDQRLARFDEQDDEMQD